MRNSFDWTPYRRSTVGFDRLFDFLETGGSGADRLTGGAGATGSVVVEFTVNPDGSVGAVRA